jgi:hypothetical protein
MNESNIGNIFFRQILVAEVIASVEALQQESVWLYLYEQNLPMFHDSP